MSLKPALLNLIAAALASVALSGCLYRMPVQQGNFLEDKELNQIEVGMTRTQVRYLLGTPMVADPFTNSRWDYVYTIKARGLTAEQSRRHFIVHFDGDKVVKIERSEEKTS